MGGDCDAVVVRVGPMGCERGTGRENCDFVTCDFCDLRSRDAQNYLLKDM